MGHGARGAEREGFGLGIGCMVGLGSWFASARELTCRVWARGLERHESGAAAEEAVVRTDAICRTGFLLPAWT